MLIQVHTDKNIEGTEAFAAHVKGVVENALSNVSDRVTRVEVHVSDQNSSDKSGQDDKRCVMEARMEGRKPTAVTHQAASVGEAVDGAADKLQRSLETAVEKLQSVRRDAKGKDVLGADTLGADTLGTDTLGTDTLGADAQD